MKQLILTILLSLSLASYAQATTYFIDDAGSNAQDGSTPAKAFQTFTYAITDSRAGCGDTLIVMDGTYTEATNGNIVIDNFRCTITTPLTIVAQNQRAPLFQNDGAPSSPESLKITRSSYIIIDGLRFKSVDNILGQNQSYNMNLVAGLSGGLTDPSDNITLRNLIFSHNNRYVNQSLLRIAGANNVLVEDTELYSFHRHGLTIGGNASNNVVRRLYCNSRDYADISGGYNSSTPDRGEGCATNYTTAGTANSDNNIFENIISEGNGAGFDMEAVIGPSNNKYYGNISINDVLGFIFKARGTSLITQQPLDAIIKDAVVITPNSVGLELRGNRNTTVTNATIYGSVNQYGFWTDIEGSGASQYDGSGTVSFTASNILSTANHLGGFTLTEQTSWTVTNANTYGNLTANVPAANGNNGTYVSPSPPNSATAPGLGTCRVYRPDGSAAKTNNWGADILYRYVNGQITTTPLWDPTTGVFPHGAIIAGVNDTASTSLYNVHQRLNVNYNGCAFPASFPGGTLPQNPSNWDSAIGTTSATAHLTIDTGMDSVTVGVALYSSIGNVGSVTGVTGCSSQDIPALSGASVVTATGFRRMTVFGKINPTAGSNCSFTASTTGNVDAVIVTVVKKDGISGYGAVGATTNGSFLPSVTVVTTTSDTILDFLAAKCNLGSGICDTNLTVGANQTLQKDTPHTTTTVDLRSASSEQSGNNGGAMDYTLTTNSSWAFVAVVLQPSVPDPPVGWELKQTAFRIHGLYGLEASPQILPHASVANNTPVTGYSTSAFRIRFELTGFSATVPALGVTLACRKNADSYTAVLNQFNGKVFRMYGPSVDPLIPSSNTPTTQQLSVGNFAAGGVIRTDVAQLTTPSLAVGDHTEVEYALALDAAVGDTIDCRMQQTDGTVLTYNQTPRFTVADVHSNIGF